MKYDTVYRLIRASIWNQEVDITEDIDWNEIYAECRVHAILGIVGKYLIDNKLIKDKLAAEWSNQTLRKQVMFQHLLEVQNKATELLSGIKHVVVKGTAAGIYYNEYSDRTYGDIDILMNPKDIVEACEILKANGFRFLGDSDRHVEFSYENVEIEVHRYFSSGIADTDKELDGILYDAISRSVTSDMYGKVFHRLPDLENGLVLLYHIKQHLKMGLGLRQIIDWMMYADKCLDKEDNAAQFLKMADRVGLKNLAIVVTDMCQMYLGLSSGIKAADADDKELSQQLMLYIMDRGNFGQKDENQRGTSMYVLCSGENIFARLQKRGVHNWKLAQKYKVLKPFAWLYQLVRYTVKGMQREKPIQALIEDMKEAKVRKRFEEMLND